MFKDFGSRIGLVYEDLLVNEWKYVINSTGEIVDNLAVKLALEGPGEVKRSLLV